MAKPGERVGKSVQKFSCDEENKHPLQEQMKLSIFKTKKRDPQLILEMCSGGQFVKYWE